MVTVKECVAQLEKADPKMKIRNVKDYGSDYLLTYSYDGENVIQDPFILVNKTTGKTSDYTIADDPAKYYSAKDLPIER